MRKLNFQYKIIWCTIYSGGDSSKYERPRVINRTPVATKLSPIERASKTDIVGVLAAHQQYCSLDRQ